MIDTILFDLDGTLLPMSQDHFIKAYFGEIVKKCAPLGYEKDSLIKALWTGTNAMIANDGENSNCDVFWKTFANILGDGVLEHKPIFDKFYEQEFDNVRQIITPTDLSHKIVKSLREKGYAVILATNPIFPHAAVMTRLHWINLDLSDFDYITTYENSSYCKPNPAYFEQILLKIGKKPENCLMVGNNAIEDLSAAKIGIATYLVTDFMEDGDKVDLTNQQKGRLKDFAAYAENMPSI